jgi:hypothetical protein
MSVLKSLSIICLSLFVIAVLHLAGVYLRLYWRLPQYDTFLHICGGAWVGLVALTSLPYLPVAFTQKKNIILSGLSIVILVGVLWEIFEVLIGFSIITDPLFIGDTITDLCADIIGGAIILLLWKQKKQQ